MYKKTYIRKIKGILPYTAFKARHRDDICNLVAN